jgi:cytochrome bd-type quinol oxidase subunit 1
MFPSFDLPYFGLPWLVGLVSITHVFISHFGVGGGLFLPLMEREARKHKDLEFLAYLKHHAKFFLVLTGVFGASTGVGIWFAISLANPMGTRALIHIFVMAWAVEWVCFLLEMTAATFYYYSWDKVSPEAHLKIGWVYAASSWMTLVIINGILTFMLTPGEAWHESHTLWAAYQNPGFLPSLVLRTLVAWSLTAVWGFYPATKIKNQAVRKRVLHRTALWVAPAYLLMPLAALWYLQVVPPSALEVLRGGMHGQASGNLSVATRVLMIVVMASTTMGLIVYFGPWRNPAAFGKGLAIGLMGLAFVATGSTEWVREVLRKPFVVRDVIYSSGVRVGDVEKFQTEGYLANAPWARDFAERRGGGEVHRGEALFQAQCMPCHTRDGYRSMQRLIGARDFDATLGFVKMLRGTDPAKNPYLKFMPPFSGTEAEAADLATYLQTLKAAHPEVAAN